jgi:hypothetical protein
VEETELGVEQKAIPLIAHWKTVLELFAGRVVDAIVSRKRAFSASEEYARRMDAFVCFVWRSYYDIPAHEMSYSQYDSFLDTAEHWSFGRKLALQAAESHVVLKDAVAVFVRAYRQAGEQLGKLVAYKILRLVDREARLSGSFDPPEWPDFLSWIESLGVDLIFIKKTIAPSDELPNKSEGS